MATLRERRPGVWEIRVFTGTDARGRPTQMSKTIRGGKREALLVAAEMEVGPGRASPAGRRVGDVLDAWVGQNVDTWAPSSARDQQSRVRSIKKDPIAQMPLARLSVGDVERWHTRLRREGMGDAGIKNLHGVLRAALSQAVRWGWVNSNVASLARLRSTKTQRRTVMTLDEVRAVMAATASIDPATALMLRVAAVTGARRAELAALQWTDLDANVLTIDSAIEFFSSGDGTRAFRDASTKTSNVRTVTLDPDTVVAIEALRREREPYGPWMFGLGPELVSPDRIGWWWKRARKLAGIDVKWRLHDLRHWSATVAIGQGHDVRTVAGRLGHANPAMTLRVYAQAFAAADQAVAAALDRIPNQPVQVERDVGQSSGMEVLARLGTDQQALADFCRRNGIRRLAVFGSALRDDFTPDSDVDLLVEFEPGQVPGMFRISGMELELEEKVFHCRRVDLRTAAELGQRFRDRVVAEAAPVYDAAA